MENLMFVAWLLGWPIVCSITDKIGPWEGIYEKYVVRCEQVGKKIVLRPRSEVIVVVIVRILVWIGAAILLYRQ